jgi:hypothetical protein
MRTDRSLNENHYLWLTEIARIVVES